MTQLQNLPPILYDRPPMTESYKPSLLNNQCLGKDIIYFSFVIPLHNKIVYDFAIGCATGQSFFVAIEKQCNCLVWASIPFRTTLSGYCLFEILIDTSRGGSFGGCQHVLDHLFRSYYFSSKVNLFRMPYATERMHTNRKNDTFISTLKKIFGVQRLCDLVNVSHSKFNLHRETAAVGLGETLVPDGAVIRTPHHRVSYRAMTGKPPQCDNWQNDRHKLSQSVQQYEEARAMGTGNAILSSSVATLTPDCHITAHHHQQHTQPLSAKEVVQITIESDFVTTANSQQSKQDISATMASMDISVPGEPHAQETVQHVAGQARAHVVPVEGGRNQQQQAQVQQSTIAQSCAAKRAVNSSQPQTMMHVVERLGNKMHCDKLQSLKHKLQDDQHGVTRYQKSRKQQLKKTDSTNAPTTDPPTGLFHIASTSQLDDGHQRIEDKCSSSTTASERCFSPQLMDDLQQMEQGDPVWVSHNNTSNSVAKSALPLPPSLLLWERLLDITLERCMRQHVF